MATAREVIGTLQSRGVILESDGAGGLRVNGISRLSEQDLQFIRQHKASILKALAADSAVSTGPASLAPVEASTAVTEALPTHTEVPDPESGDRFCSQCQHFDRSPYGYPLGLCAEHGMPEGSFSDVRGNRIQHATGRPAHFGCVDFVLRPPADETRTCLVCRNYNPVSTMCRVVNTGCLYPHIPPCRGESFELAEVRA